MHKLWGQLAASYVTTTCYSAGISDAVNFVIVIIVIAALVSLVLHSLESVLVFCYN